MLAMTSRTLLNTLRALRLPSALRRLLAALCLCLVVAQTLSAQFYDALWKQLQAARTADKPQTALNLARQIATRALDEGNAPQLLAALLEERVSLGDISADSLKPAADRLLARANAMTEGVERSIYESALGQLRATQSGYRRDTLSQRLACEHLLRSLADMPALAKASQRQWLPLLTAGNDASFYGSDMLMPLLQAATSYAHLFPAATIDSLRSRAIAVYDRLQRREMALLLRLEAAQTWSDARATDSLRLWSERYASLSLNALTLRRLADHLPDSARYATLQQALQRYPKTAPEHGVNNQLREMTQPMFSLSSMPEAVHHAGQTLRLPLSHRGLASITLTLQPLSLTPIEAYGLTAEKIGTSHYRGRAIVQTVRLRQGQPWEIMADTLSLTLPEAGTYLLTARTDLGLEQRQFLSASNIVPLVVHTTQNQQSQMRVTPTRFSDGKPLLGGQLIICQQNSNGTLKTVSTLSADASGHIFLPANFAVQNRLCFLKVDNDIFPEALRLRHSNPYTVGQPNQPALHLYADRAVYRPGQQVCYGLILHDRHADSLAVLARQQVRVVLLDANRKEIASQVLTTDAYGAAGDSLLLPAETLPGRFTLRATYNNGSAAATCSFSVEAYKRPSFTVSLTAPSQAYSPGDTIVVSGTARTLYDTPVRQARVEISQSLVKEDGIAQRDTLLLTDDEGRFCLSAIVPPARKRFFLVSNLVSARVIAQNGESQEASLRLWGRSPAAVITAAWPSLLCREELPSLTAACTNAAGAVLEGPVGVEISKDNVRLFSDTVSATHPLAAEALKQLPCGLLTCILTHPLAAPDTLRLRLFSLADSLVADAPDEPLFYDRTSLPDGQAETLVLMPAREQYIIADRLPFSGAWTSQTIEGQGRVLRFDLTYNPREGDSQLLLLNAVSRGRTFSHRLSVARPVPDKRLVLTWHTFRSRLTPGQTERWTLQVSHPDGTPAHASVMATIYDAALDQIAVQPWNLSFHFPRNTVQAWQTTFSPSGVSLYAARNFKYDTERTFDFTRWDDRFFPAFGRNLYFTTARGGQLRMAKNAAVETVAMASLDAAPMAVEATADYAEAVEEKTVDLGNTATPKIRSNFDETAYFSPSLTTDANGRVGLVFTLPESLTQWNVRLLAHDKTMRHATLLASAVARRPLVVKPNMPRFLFEADQSQLAVDVENLSEEAQQGTLTLQVLDAATLKPLSREQTTFSLAPQAATTLQLPLAAPENTDEIVVKVVAATPNYSDGEEHRLSILRNLATVVNTAAFTLRGGQTVEAALDTLFRGNGRSHELLRVDLTERPLMAAAEALPVLNNSMARSATELSERLYAILTAQHLAALHPELEALARKHADAPANSAFLEASPLTPWLRQAEQEEQRRQSLATLFDPAQQALLAQTTLQRLLQLQVPSGGFAWLPGLKENAFVTARVALLLSRLEKNVSTPEIENSLSRAAQYLEKCLDRRVEEMKRLKTKYATTLDLQMLYTLGRNAAYKPNANARTLLALWEPATSHHTMYERALQTVVLQRFGKTRLAHERLESLLEHLAGSSALGRYFDSHRTASQGASYTLPTHTLAIEAIESLLPQAADTLQSMRHWLLQQKRTTLWATSTATADALHCLLGAPDASLDTSKGISGNVLCGSRAAALLLPDPTRNLSGHYSVLLPLDSIPQERPLVLLARADSALPQAWISATASYTLPASEADAAAEGMMLQAKMEVERDGKWVEINPKTTIAMGSRVRQVFVVSLERDYDFLRLRAPHQACLEIGSSRAGTTFQSGMLLYRAPADDYADYFFDHLAKGTYTLTETFTADRRGTFRCAPATLESVYAPEFQARAKSQSLSVK